MGLDGKKDAHFDGSLVEVVSRLEVLEGPSGRRVRSAAEKARIVAESLMPGAQVSEVARKHGATRWQVYDWRRRLRQRGELPSHGASRSTFAPLVVEGLARHPKWSLRYDLRLQLIRHPLTPLALALAFLPDLKPEDLLLIATDQGMTPTMRAYVQAEAQRRLHR